MVGLKKKQHPSEVANIKFTTILDNKLKRAASIITVNVKDLIVFTLFVYNKGR